MLIDGLCKGMIYLLFGFIGSSLTPIFGVQHYFWSSILKLILASLPKNMGLRHMQLSAEMREKANKIYEELKTRYLRSEIQLFDADSEGYSMPKLAMMLGDLDKIKWIVAQDNDAAPTLINSTNFMAGALYYGNIDFAKYLIEQGMNFVDVLHYHKSELVDGDERVSNFYNEQCHTIISNALQSGVASLENKIPNKTLSISYLQLAARIGDIGLLEHGYHQILSENKYYNQGKSWITAADKDGNTALHLAVKEGNVELVNRLITNGADINAQNRLGETAVYLAVHRGQLGCVQILAALGANIAIPTFFGETIYHAQHHSKIDLGFLDSHAEAEKLKQSRTIFNDSPDDLIHEKQLDFSQNIYIDQMSKYLSLSERSTDYFFDMNGINEGLCNGLGFYKNYLDSRGQGEIFYGVLEMWLNWDGSNESLQDLVEERYSNEFRFEGEVADDGVKPKINLKKSEVFDRFLDHVLRYQVQDMTKVDLKIKQRERKKQLDLTGQSDFINIYLNEFSSNVNYLKLSEILQLLCNYPKNTYFEICGGQHLTTVKYVGDNKFEYFDPNFPGKLTAPLTAEQLADLIIKTKYIKLSKENNDGSCPITVLAYRFKWQENEVSHHTQLKDTDMPKSSEDVVSFTEKSSCGFNQLHVAILTRDKAHLRQIIQDGYCDINISTRLTPPQSALDLLYVINDEELTNIFLSSSQFTIKDDDIFSRAYRDKNLAFITSVIAHPGVNHLNDLFKLAASNNDLAMMHTIAKLNKVDLATAASVLMRGDSNTVDDFIIEQFSNNVISSDDSLLLHFFAEDRLSLFKMVNTPESPLIRAAISLIEHMPATIDTITALKVLNAISVMPISETDREKYISYICERISNVSELINGKYTLLEYFVAHNDSAITQALITRMQPEAISHRYSEDKKTALHTALRLTPETETEKSSRKMIVAALISHHSDLDVKDKQGYTCRQLLENHADVDISAMSPSEVKKPLIHHFSMFGGGAHHGAPKNDHDTLDHQDPTLKSRKQ